MSYDVIAFPVISAIISLLCAGVLTHDARRRPRPDKVIWALAFLMFALAAGADAAGRSIAWTPWLARLYYSTGPALVVMFLAIGELYLLFPRVMSKFGAGATVLLTAFWVAMVTSAPIDHARLAADGWEAIERGTAMVVITVLINAIGTIIIVGGTGYSVWTFWRQGIMRNRMFGCALIALGTLAVGAGGTLTRLGHYEYLYIAMSVGVALIFAGVLETRRPDSVVAKPSQSSIASGADGPGPAARSRAPIVASLNGSSKPGRADLTDDSGNVLTGDSSPFAVHAMNGEGDPGSAIGYIEGSLLTLPDNEVAWLCEEWSVPRDATPVLTRSEARQVWKLRQRLTVEGTRAFDRHSVTVRRQLALLHDDVLTSQDLDEAASSGFAAVDNTRPAHATPEPINDMYDDLAVPYS